MIHEGTLSQRIRYHVIDILGDVGGINSAIVSLFLIFFSAYNYKLHESVVYQVYLKAKGISKHSKRYKQIENGNKRCLSLKLYMYDTYRFFKDFCEEKGYDGLSLKEGKYHCYNNVNGFKEYSEEIGDINEKER